jgi:hypothetical protein
MERMIGSPAHQKHSISAAAFQLGSRGGRFEISACDRLPTLAKSARRFCGAQNRTTPGCLLPQRKLFVRKITYSFLKIGEPEYASETIARTLIGKRRRSVGDILKFEPKRSGKVLRKHDASASAVIIIFSGIRYERLTGANTKTRAGGKSKRSLVVTNPPATHRSL